MYTPVMERNGNKFCLSYKNLMRPNWLDAYLLGFDLAHKYGIENGFEYNGVILRADRTGGKLGTLNDLRISIVEGPAMEEIDGGSTGSSATV